MKTHSCECGHEAVRYCKRCQVVHCLNCSFEWHPKYNWGYQYLPNYVWNSGTTTLKGTSTLTTSNATGGTLTTSLCTHNNDHEQDGA